MNFLLFSLLVSCNQSNISSSLTVPQYIESINIVSPFANKSVYYNSFFTDYPTKTLSLMKDVLPGNENSIVSPICYSLCMLAKGFASENNSVFLNDLGVSDFTDFKKIVEALNWQSSDGESEDSKIRSVMIDAIVSSLPNIYFDSSAEKELNDNYISTIKTNKGDFSSDIQEYVSKVLDTQISLPNLEDLEDDSTSSVAGLYVKDSIDDLNTTKNTFNGKSKTIKTDGNKFQDISSYYKGSNYQVFRYNVNFTNMVIILPDEEVELSSINYLDAYNAYLDNCDRYSLNGWLPYFELEETLPLNTVSMKLSDDLSPYTYLVKGDFHQPNSCLQKNKFSFNKHGIEGTSITIEYCDGSAYVKKEAEVNVTRPFYAISLYDNLPLFAMSVCDI